MQDDIVLTLVPSHVTVCLLLSHVDPKRPPSREEALVQSVAVLESMEVQQ